MRDAKATLGFLKGEIARFIRARDWEQFHSPKNLSMSISIESAELMEIFQWMEVEEARSKSGLPELRARIEEEIADIAIYILSLCNTIGIDVSSCILRKLKKNRKKYPVAKSKGKW